ncbi:zinc knuckle CX2CX4HX4C containing protein [Tanacetum coccineum]
MEKTSSGANNGSKPLKLILKKTSRGETIVVDDLGRPQSPLVSCTAPLPLHQVDVDVAATFEVSLSTVGDLKVLITDIDAGKLGELLSGMTNDKHKVVFDAFGSLCDFIKVESASPPGFESDGSRNESSVLVTMHTSSHVEEVLIHSIDDVVALFGVSLNSLKDIDEFTKDLEVGKYDLWLELTKETRSGITDIIWNRWDTLVNLQKSAPTVDDNLSGEASLSDTIIQSVDINTKSTSYARAAGASAKDQPKVNSNFRHLVADPVFDGVNISIPHKVVEKVGLEAVLEGGPWLIRNSPIILKKWSMDTRLLKEELTRIPIGKKRKGKSKSTNGGQFVGPLVKQIVMYEPKATTSEPKKGATNVALENEEEEDEEHVENVYDESANLFTNSKTGESSSFMAAAG